MQRKKLFTAFFDGCGWQIALEFKAALLQILEYHDHLFCIGCSQCFSIFQHRIVAKEQLRIPLWFPRMQNQIKIPKRTWDHRALMCKTNPLSHTVLILSTFCVFTVIGPAVCNLIGSITNTTQLQIILVLHH